MRVELSDVQVKQLIGILSNATIKGGEAQAILELAKAIQTPLTETKADSPITESKADGTETE